MLDKAMRLEEPSRGPSSSRKKSEDTSDDTTDDEKASWGGNGHANGSAGGMDGSSEFSGMGTGEVQRRGLLGPRVKGVLVVACKYLEKGEKMGL